MSENTETIETPVSAPAPEVAEAKAPTPEEVLAAKNAEEKKKFDDRVTELKVCEGKTYQPKNPGRGHENQIVTVISYEGVAQIDPTGKSDARNVRQAHIFLCESKNPDFRWKPAATVFLENFQEVTINKSEINKEVL